MEKRDIIELLNYFKTQNRQSISDELILEVFTIIKKMGLGQMQAYKIASIIKPFDKAKLSFSKDTYEVFRKIVILEFLLDSWNDIHSEKYPQSVQEQYLKNYQRMLDMCRKDDGWSQYIDDVYWKDLAIARQQSFPAGSGIVEAYSGFSYRNGFCINPSQSFRFIRLLIHSGGRRGYYQIHTHTPLLGEFNEQGWHDSYIRIAEMLNKHRNIKGVFRASWFCDPEVANVSPRLEYLQKSPVDNGAKLFYVGEDLTGNAFAKSKTRLQLYNEGKYKPKTYLLVWPRKELIEWASKYIELDS